MYPSNLAYRQASLEGATQIELIILVYEALAADLLRAGQAVSQSRIQERCEASNHALSLLGHLESWTGDLDDAVLAKSLGTLYSYLRKQIVVLQVGGKQDQFEALSSVVLEVRSTWQEKARQAHQAFKNASTAPEITAVLGEPVQPRAAWFA